MIQILTAGCCEREALQDHLLSLQQILFKKGKHPKTAASAEAKATDLPWTTATRSCFLANMQSLVTASKTCLHHRMASPCKEDPRRTVSSDRLLKQEGLQKEQIPVTFSCLWSSGTWRTKMPSLRLLVEMPGTEKGRPRNLDEAIFLRSHGVNFTEMWKKQDQISTFSFLKKMFH